MKSYVINLDPVHPLSKASDSIEETGETKEGLDSTVQEIIKLVYTNIDMDSCTIS